MKKKYYEFNQNNSGGGFEKSLPKELFIEADSMEDAIRKAFSLGVYFDGVSLGLDCECCGDRWHEPNELVFPYKYTSFPREEAKQIAEKYKGKAESKKNHWGQYGVTFNDIKSYMKFIKDRHGKNSIYDGVEYCKLVTC